MCTDIVPYKKTKNKCYYTNQNYYTNEHESVLVEVVVQFPEPINGIDYTLSEVFTVYEREFNSVSVSKFIRLAKKEFPPLIIYDRATFYRYYKVYIKNSIAPPFQDQVLFLVYLPFIPKFYINDLNDGLEESNGEGEDYLALGVRMVDIANEQLVSRGMYADTSFPVQSTLDLYNLKAPLCDNAVTLVWYASLTHKTVRRQVAGRSVRNCMSRICAIACAHFAPTNTKYAHPNGSMSG